MVVLWLSAEKCLMFKVVFALRGEKRPAGCLHPREPYSLKSGHTGDPRNAFPKPGDRLGGIFDYIFLWLGKPGWPFSNLQQSFLQLEASQQDIEAQAAFGNDLFFFPRAYFIVAS